MFGFELIINGENISTVLDSGVVSIIAIKISKGEINYIELQC